MQRHPHLATGGEDVHGSIVVAGQKGSIGRRWLGELVHLVTQRGDVVPRLAQRIGQLLVLRYGLGQLSLGFKQAFFQGAHPLGGVGNPAPQKGNLVFKRTALVA